MQLKAVLTFLFLSSLALAKRLTDKVSSLPMCPPLPTAWYSGYLNASPTKQLHYVFVESLDQPATDPVIVWFNGGPGCSSMLALFQEHGPFIIDDDESFIKPNPFPWNQRANVLYIESPAGVGYSLAATIQDRTHTDMSQSIDAFEAMKDFYKSWPELLTTDLYITGESYAGIYVPYLSWQIHQWNQMAKLDRSNSTLKYPLKGFMIGNGATHWDYDGDVSYAETLFNLNIIS